MKSTDTNLAGIFKADPSLFAALNYTKGVLRDPLLKIISFVSSKK